MAQCKKSPPTKNCRVVLYFAEAYRNLQGSPRSKMVERIGYLDELEKEFKNSVVHFKRIAKQKTKEQQQRLQPITIEFAPEARLLFEEHTKNYDCVKNIGHTAIS